MRKPRLVQFLLEFLSMFLVGLASIAVMNRIRPPESIDAALGRIVIIATSCRSTFIIMRLIRDAWGRRFVFLATPIVPFFYTYILLLVYRRIDNLELPSDLLFTMLIVASLIYGLFAAAVKFRDAPSILGSRDLILSYMSTIGIASVIAYGALRIAGDLVQHMSLGFAQLPYFIVGTPVILLAQFELTRREIKRPY